MLAIGLMFQIFKRVKIRIHILEKTQRDRSSQCSLSQYQPPFIHHWQFIVIFNLYYFVSKYLDNTDLHLKFRPIWIVHLNVVGAYDYICTISKKSGLTFNKSYQKHHLTNSTVLQDILHYYILYYWWQWKLQFLAVPIHLN